MPSLAQLVAVGVIAGVCALLVALALIALGLGEHAPIAAAVSAATSSAVAMNSVRSSAAGE